MGPYGEEEQADNAVNPAAKSNSCSFDVIIMVIGGNLQKGIMARNSFLKHQALTARTRQCDLSMYAVHIV